MRLENFVLFVAISLLQKINVTMTKKGLAVGFREYMCNDLEAWNNLTWWWVFHYVM